MKPCIPWSSFLLLACLPAWPAPCRPSAASAPPADGASAAEMRNEPAYRPRFEEGPCWAPIPAGVAARCGYVAVPEDRSRPPGDGNMVRLAVAVLSAPGVNHATPPTFLLGGGPGADIVGVLLDLLGKHRSLHEDGFPAEQYDGHRQEMEGFKAVMDLFTADLQKRAFVVFDQRGTGYSQPSLKCRDEDWRTCRARLVASGVDVAAYNTLASVRDLDDVRRALDYDRINLHGGSYGTRLALEVMRQDRGVVRAAVLDGVAPPQIDWAVEMVARYDDALEVLFDHCRADAACDAAYPDLEATFYAQVDRLNRRPLNVRVGDRVVTLDGDDLRDFVWNALYDAPAIRYLPMLVRDVSRGDAGLWGRMLALKGDDDAAMAWGMHYAVECAERWPFETPQQLAAAGRDLPDAIREPVVRSFASTFRTCDVWAVPAAPALVHTPVRSDVPTLLLSGEFDPGTQPVFAEMAARTLPHHYHYVLPYRGHCDGFTSPCQAAIVSAFLDDPTRAPDTTCIADMDRSPFVVDGPGS